MSAYTSRKFYFALKKQTALDTPAVPDTFFRWIDGTTVEPEMKIEEVYEGDGSRDVSLVFKTGQWWKGKLVAYVRPQELGHLLQAVFGSGADTASVVGVSTTLAASASAGATTVSSTATFSIGDVVQIGSGGTAEYRTLTNVSGAGPYTLTFTGGLTYAHASGQTVARNTTHTFSVQDDLNYYTIEMGATHAALIAGSKAPIYRVQDCIFTKFEVEGESNRPIKVSAEFMGRKAIRQSTALTVTLEDAMPLSFVNGLYVVDSLSVAGNIHKFKLGFDNGVDSDIFTTQITPDDFIATTRKINLEAEIIFDDDKYFRKAFFGSTTGSTDAAQLGEGTVDFTFYENGVATAISNLNLQGDRVVHVHDPITPKLDGKAIRQMLKFTFEKPSSGQIIDAVLKNIRTSAY